MILLHLGTLFQQGIGIIHMKCTKKNIPSLFNLKSLLSKKYILQIKKILWMYGRHLINWERFKIQQRVREDVCPLHLKPPSVSTQHSVSPKKLWEFIFPRYLSNAPNYLHAPYRYSGLEFCVLFCFFFLNFLIACVGINEPHAILCDMCYL